MNRDIYRDISSRTDGNIYIGVVGPVRSGKSTFIKRFMETFILPNIEDTNKLRRAIDEMPQSADGKTIMTTQPRFVPEDAVELNFKDGCKARFRMVDCVGYMVDGAIGDSEDGKERMVKTPWSDKEMPFSKAAEVGTKKVISDHSTINIVVTTDGSISQIERIKYISAEEKVIADAKASGKPFIIVLNTNAPRSKENVKLVEALSLKYTVKVVAMDILNATSSDMQEILSSLMLEFPVETLSLDMPKWMQVLDDNHYLISEITSSAEEIISNCAKMKDCRDIDNNLKLSDNFDGVDIDCDISKGNVCISVRPKQEVFFRVLSEQCDIPLGDDFSLMAYVKRLRSFEDKFAMIKDAMDDVENNGYGIVIPTMSDMELKEPQVVKKGAGYGVKLRASAPSLHIMKVDVETEVNPVVGTEQQGEDMIKYLMSEFESDPSNIWETNMFGKPLSSLVKEGINSKLTSMPIDAKAKMRKTVGKIVNEGRGGVVCILL